MATSKAKKLQISEFLEGEVLTQKSIVLLTTKDAKASIDAQTNYDVRKEARSQGIVLKVVKNSILKKMNQELPELSGQTFLGFLENKEESDEITVPKVVIKLATSKFKDNFKVVGAIVNGEFLESNQAIALSKVPSKEESMAIVATQLNSLATKLATLVKEIPTTVSRAVQEVAKTKS